MISTAAGAGITICGPPNPALPLFSGPELEEEEEREAESRSSFFFNHSNTNPGTSPYYGPS